MNKLFNVRTLGLITVVVILLSGIFFTLKNRQRSATVWVPVDIAPKNAEVPPKLAPAPHDTPDDDPPPLVNQPSNVNVGPAPVIEIDHKSDDSKVLEDRGDKKSVDDLERPDRVDKESVDDLERPDGVDKESVDDLERPVPDNVDREGLMTKLQQENMIGQVNYDLWWNVVGYFVDDLRIFKYYPNHPDERKTLKQLHIDFHNESPNDPGGRYGHKVYGYILPPKPGIYEFKFVMDKLTAAASVELWISSGSNPLDTQKTLVLEYDDLSRPTRRAMTTLDKKESYKFIEPVHYFEFLMKAYEGHAIVDLLWRPPDSESFIPIPNSNIAMAVQVDGSGGVVEGEIIRLLQDPLPSNKLQTHHRAYYVGNIIYPITRHKVLPDCEFHSLYSYPRRVKAYTGVNQVVHSLVYPKDETWFKNWHKADNGNPVIQQDKVDHVMSLYKDALKKDSSREGQVAQLVSLEETPNKDDGSRFLLELVLELNHPRELINTSEYVYLPSSGDKLCHTVNFQWQSGVNVYLVVAVKNLGFWIKHLMQNMEEIYTATKDEKFFLVVTDYSSQDANVEELMSQSSFKNWHVINLPGDFSRSAGLQAGINYVTDPDSIVMTIDMHLTLPTGFVEAVRRHTIQGKMAYTPYFFRLNKGYTEVNYNGFWETLTYGLFGMFKSDWTNFGGFNLKKYKTQWGGEDWDILDRSLAKGYEAFRLRVPGLVHYYHTKAGMWGGKAHD